MRFLDRREFLKFGSAAALGGSALPLAAAAPPSAPSPSAQATADYTIRIATGLIEPSPEHIVSTTLYNSQFPGPLLRFKEGQRVIRGLSHSG
jgi:FtsP/CotA-like multicopper oxidase with cupredoxin domain